MADYIFPNLLEENKHAFPPIKQKVLCHVLKYSKQTIKKHKHKNINYEPK